MFENLKMLTREDVAEVLNVSPDQVTMFREQNVLQATRTGKNWMFSQKEVERFQEEYKGYDVSNQFKIIETKRKIKELNDQLKVLEGLRA